MPRLPIPGKDQGAWGQILNDYLSQAHNSDGSLKAGSVNGASIADSSVTQSKLSVGSGSAGNVLTTDGTNLTWATPAAGGTIPDATTTARGVVQLAGDLGGTAASPTVPGLAGKEPVVAFGTSTQYYRGDKTWQSLNKTSVGLENVDNTSDINKPVSTAVQTALAAKVDSTDARLTNQRTPSDTSVTPAKLDAVAAPTNGQILSYNGTRFNWVAAPTGGNDPVMGGDLSGTASNAQIAAGAVGTAELAANAVTSAKIADVSVVAAKLADDSVTEPKLAASNAPTTGQVLTYNGTDLAWATPATGGSSGYNFRNITSSTTAVANDFIFADSSTGAITITLPAPTTSANVRIKRLNPQGNGVQIVAPSGSFIDGPAVGSHTVNNQFESQDFLSNGTNWYRV